MVTVAMLEFQVEFPGMRWVIPFLNLQPVVGKFLGHAPKKQRMESQQIQRSLMIPLILQQQEILLP